MKLVSLCSFLVTVGIRIESDDDDELRGSTKTQLAAESNGTYANEGDPAPTLEPTEAPTQDPTEAPTLEPTEAPTQDPTEEPTLEPTEEPTQDPTEAATNGSMPKCTDQGNGKNYCSDMCNKAWPCEISLHSTCDCGGCNGCPEPTTTNTTLLDTTSVKGQKTCVPNKGECTRGYVYSECCEYEDLECKTGSNAWVTAGKKGLCVKPWICVVPKTEMLDQPRVEKGPFAMALKYQQAYRRSYRYLNCKTFPV